MPEPTRLHGAAVLSEELSAAVRAAVGDRRQALVELTSALVGFETTARLDPAERARDEQALQELLAARLKAVGAEVELVEPEPERRANEPQMVDGIHFRGRPQLIARIPGSGDGKSILLNGHIDVVPAGPRAAWRRDPFEAHVEDGLLYGRGACDMKGGIAAMVVAVETLAALGVSLKGDVIVNTVTDEESSGAGALACAWHGVRADACIVPEPTNLEIWLGCRGTCLATVEIDGRAAHVEIPQPDWTEGGGVNAIEKAMVVLGGLDRLNHRWASDPEHEHEFLSPGRISPVRIEAGDWPVTIPDRCEVDFDVTFPPALADEEGWDSRVREEVEAELDAIAASDPWLGENPPRLSWAMATPPLEISADSAPVPELCWALGQIGRERRFTGLDSWYDGATFARVHGVPAAGFGPGRIDVAHTRDEYVPVDDLVDCAATIALALVSHCGLAADWPAAGTA